MLYGPNTNNGSIITMIEYQVEYALAHIRRIAAQRLAWVDVKSEPMARLPTTGSRRASPASSRGTPAATATTAAPAAG